MNVSEVVSELENLLNSKKRTFIVITEPETYHKASLPLLRHLTSDKEFSGIYVTFNKTYRALREEFESAGIDKEKILFIDGTSDMNKEDSDKNAKVLENPRSLTSLSIAVSDASKSGVYKFVFLDSLSTLLVYNSLEAVEEFSHHFMNKIRSMGLFGFLICMTDEKTEKMIPIITQFSDYNLEL